jgi:hypothetical protein
VLQQPQVFGGERLPEDIANRNASGRRRLGMGDRGDDADEK